MKGENYYCKKYVNYNSLKIIQDFFRNHRAARAFKISHFLNNNNIKTVKPILVVYKTFSKSSVFITKECKGVSLENVFLKDMNEGEKYELIMKLIETYKSLVELKIYHRDPNLSNFLLLNGELILIDMDDIRKKLSVFPFINLLINLEKFNRILLLSYIRKKEINFNNEDREFIIKTLIKNFYNHINENFFLKFINLYTRLKMQKYLKKENGITRYLRGGTIEEVNNYLFSKNMGKC